MFNVNQTCLLALPTGSTPASSSKRKGLSVIASAGDISTGNTITLKWTAGDILVYPSPGTFVIRFRTSRYFTINNQPL